MTHYRPSVTERNQKFIKWWKKKRKHKWRFIISGGLLWGLPVSIGSYLLFIRFNFDQFDVIDVAIRSAVFIIVGILYTYWFYHANEKRFKQLSSDSTD